MGWTRFTNESTESAATISRTVACLVSLLLAGCMVGFGPDDGDAQFARGGEKGPPDRCGNGKCQQAETCDTCPEDCGVCPVDPCGDGVCSGNESCTTCSEDCGACPVDPCGDGVCSGDESCTTCSEDCGTCDWPCDTSMAFHVSTSGSDAAAGTQSEPWATLQKAADSAPDGATVFVHAGTYDSGAKIRTTGVCFLADDGVVVNSGLNLGGVGNLVSGFVFRDTSDNPVVRIYGESNVLEDCDPSQSRQDGIWFFGVNNTIRGNYIHDILNHSDGDPHADCFQTWGPAENILFEGNLCHHNRTSGSNQITMVENLTSGQKVDHLIFKNNLFVMEDGGYSPMNFVRKAGQDPVTNIVIIGNTLVNTAGGDQAVRLTDVDGSVVQNNLLYNYGSTYSKPIDTNGGSAHVADHNAVFREDGTTPEGGPNPGDIWMEDPMVSNAAQLDFRLQSGSPLIDAGADVSLGGDFDGNLRPVGAGYDIGAFEHQAP